MPRIEGPCPGREVFAYAPKSAVSGAEAALAARKSQFGVVGICDAVTVATTG
jgi:hypothetical protein